MRLRIREVKPKLGVKVTLTPGDSVNGTHWTATAIYRDKKFETESYSKEGALSYIEQDIRRQIEFNSLKPEEVEI